MEELKGWKDVGSELKKIKIFVKQSFFKFLIAFFRQIQLFSYSKVFINVTLTFIFPVIMFSIPILLNSNATLSSNIMNKLGSGVLFSTSISISATIISSYVDNASLSSSEDKKTKKMKIMTKVLPLLIYALMCTVLGAYYFGQVTEDLMLNTNGIVIQIVLYIIVQIIYGMMDSKIKNSKSIDISEEQEKYEQEEEDITNKNKRKLDELYENSQNRSNNKKL
ncbi:hypothetical protein [Carnobacterium maltaromaticum]